MATPPVGQSCLTCKALFHGGCHRGPPRQGHGEVSRWRPVADTDWCPGWAPGVKDVTETCNNCPLWIIATCRANLPAQTTGDISLWPPTDHDEWCMAWGFIVTTPPIITKGTFTLDAAASTVIVEPKIAPFSHISLTAINFGAAVLQGSAAGIFPNTLVIGVGFTVTTGNSTPATGSESYMYEIFN